MCDSRELGRALRAVREFVRLRTGGVCRKIQVQLEGGDTLTLMGEEDDEPPDLEIQLQPSATPLTTTPIPGWGREHDHAYGCRMVSWPGLGVFVFSADQARVVAVLYRRWEANPDAWISEVELLEWCEYPSLEKLFKGSRGWGTLIVSDGQGGYRLAS